jgi:hypothetical protein
VSKIEKTASVTMRITALHHIHDEEQHGGTRPARPLKYALGMVPFAAEIWAWLMALTFDEFGNIPMIFPGSATAAAHGQKGAGKVETEKSTGSVYNGRTCCCSRKLMG